MRLYVDPLLPKLPSRLQLLQLVQEAPVGGLRDQFLRIGLDHSDLVQAHTGETHATASQLIESSKPGFRLLFLDSHKAITLTDLLWLSVALCADLLNTKNSNANEKQHRDADCGCIYRAGDSSAGCRLYNGKRGNLSDQTSQVRAMRDGRPSTA